ncbi:MAG: hypothetical protein HY719_02715 [Planctomycetes bacterium]|nr:hypothetical protein [Planctomycetota bacterium]
MYHDKDGSFDYGGNDPFVDATVWTVPPAVPIQVTADDGFDHGDSSRAFPDYILVTTVVYTGEMINLEAIFEDLAPRGGQVSTLARGAGSAPVRASQRSVIADSENANVFASSRLGVSSVMSQRSAALNPGNGGEAPGRPESPGESPQYPNSPGNSGNAPGQTGSAGQPSGLPSSGGDPPGQVEGGAPPEGTPIDAKSSTASAGDDTLQVVMAVPAGLAPGGGYKVRVFGVDETQVVDVPAEVR